MIRIVVEVVSHRGAVPQKLRFDKSRIVIGRAYDCDLILDDPLVSEAHLEICVDGDGFIVRDLQSLNGTVMGTMPLGDEPADFVSGQALKVGDTRLRVYSSSHSVGVTQKNSLLAKMRRQISKAPLALALFLLAMVFVAFNLWMVDYSQESFWSIDGMLGTVAGIAAVAAAVALLMAAGDFFSSHRFRASLALSVVSLGLVFIIATDFVWRYINFYISDNEIFVFVVLLQAFLTLGAVMLAAQYLFSIKPVAMRHILGVVMAAVALALLVEADDLSGLFSHQYVPAYNSVLFSDASAPRAVASLSDFLETHQGLFDVAVPQKAAQAGGELLSHTKN